MPPAPDTRPERQSEAVMRRGLPWPTWVLGLIGILAGIVYLFVIQS